jgi:hypothetical protein
MQPRDEMGADHPTRVAQRQPGSSCATLDAMGPLLTSRRHVDLQRTSSAVCSEG